jgi:hypothetical protein
VRSKGGRGDPEGDSSLPLTLIMALHQGWASCEWDAWEEGSREGEHRDLMNHEAWLEFSTEPCLPPLPMAAGIQDGRRTLISGTAVQESVHMTSAARIYSYWFPLHFCNQSVDCRATEPKDGNSARSRAILERVHF